jgi:hypothetical protein
MTRLRGTRGTTSARSHMVRRGGCGGLRARGRAVTMTLVAALSAAVVIAAEPADAPVATGAATQQREERFKALVADVTLVGRFTIDRAADGPARGGDAGKGGAQATRPQAELALREEAYDISGALPLGGDLWAITARIRYGDTDVTVPVPVAVKWAGDTPVITLDTITIPGLGTFSSRVVLDGDRYAGTWQHDDVGGHMFGRIERRPRAPAKPAK